MSLKQNIKRMQSDQHATALHGTDDTASPFGGPSVLIQTLPTPYIVELYRKKCGVDIERSFHGHTSVNLYRCEQTGYRFWRPADVACDEWCYNRLSNSWSNYYRAERWEYRAARAVVKNSYRVLEIGCGRGYFLRSIEGRVAEALGLELNHGAIAQKVTKFPIEATTIELLSKRCIERFDIVCAFQVLEHIVSPGNFIQAALNCLAPGGLLVFSTPNYNYEPHQRQVDALDLPPHHMGHFEELTFYKIAQIFDLQVVKVLSEPRTHIPEATISETQKRLAYRIARTVARMAYYIAYRLCSEPGANLIAIMRKR